MKKEIKKIKLTDNISYYISDNTIYLFQDEYNFSKDDIKIIGKKVALLIQDNDISYINITAKGIEDKKSLYHDLGFTLSYYDVNKLNELFSDKKDKIKYRCYGIMTKSDFLNRLMEDKKVEEKKEKDKKQLQKKYFYVCHFIKQMDKALLETEGQAQKYLLDEYRHYEKRKEVEKQAKALLAFRQKAGKVGERIRGIDASSEEIVCRPEVFAQAFRFLKNESVQQMDYETGQMKQLPDICITYHVGEDFLDITAIFFCSVGNEDLICIDVASFCLIIVLSHCTS